jgi:hypothetical protein
MKKKAAKVPRDVNANAHRVFAELIERSEQPPNRGNLRSVAVKPPQQKRRPK